MKALIPCLAAAALLAGGLLPLKAQAAEQTSSVVIDGSDPAAALSALGYDREEFSFEKQLPTAFGTVYRFRQTEGGVPVLGRGITLSADRKGNLLSVNADVAKTQPEAPRLDAAEVSSRTDATVLSVEDTYYTFDGASERAYELITDKNGGERLVLSAMDGRTLLEAPLAGGIFIDQTDADGNTVSFDLTYHDQDEGYYLADYTRNIFAYDATRLTRMESYFSEDGVFEDSMAVSVFANAVKAYDFYAEEGTIGTTFRGVNGGHDTVAGNWEEAREIPLYLFIHYGRNYENASCGYDPSTGAALMYVGDGNPRGELYRQGKAADVIGHEYQHAVTSFTCDLIYLNDSGALNEAFSDVFGALIEGHDPSEEAFWTIGEDGVPAGASPIRSIKAPTGDSRVSAKDKYPLCNRNHDHDAAGCDNGGVHFNSTIISHLLYTLWDAEPEFFTREKMGELWYGTLCALTEHADFSDFAREFKQCAENLGYEEDILGAIDRCLLLSGLAQSEDWHVVTFLDNFGKTIGEEIVHTGEPVTPPAAPELPATEKYEYIFLGWSRELGSVTEDMVVSPLYETVLRKYSVTFLDRTGNVLKEEEVAYGESATPPVPPATESSEIYDFEFYTWDNQWTSITGDTVIRPVYNRFRCYFVDFVADGVSLKSERVRSGESATPPSDPVRASDERSDYRFTGWSGSYTHVSQSTTVTALFEEIPREYEIVYRTEDGVYRSETLHYGDPLSLPTPEREGYVFLGWTAEDGSAPPAAAEGDLTLVAAWEKTGGCKGAIGLSDCSVVLAVGLAALLLLKKKRA